MEPSRSDGSSTDGEPELDPFVRAALESLEAEVILPVRCDDELAAFLQLGGKGVSGDIYTPTDLRLLAEVADRSPRDSSSSISIGGTVPGAASPAEQVRARREGRPGRVGNRVQSAPSRPRHDRRGQGPSRAASRPIQSSWQRFEREARLMAQLRHPNIGSGCSTSTPMDSLHYLVMEYVDGER
jgi:serine/threonine protein kinase